MATGSGTLKDREVGINRFSNGVEYSPRVSRVRNIFDHC